MSVTSTPLPGTTTACLDSAHALWDGHELRVSTGLMCRTWQWTPTGFATSSLRRRTGAEHIAQAAACADWQLPGGADMRDAQVVEVRIQRADDAGFTSQHVQVVARIAYPHAKLHLELEIWVFPGAPGIRTALSAIPQAGFIAQASQEAVTVEQLRCRTCGATVHVAKTKGHRKSGALKMVALPGFEPGTYGL